jgi:3-oxoacyl-[acyl-carrier-protein] synthase II
LGIGLSANWEAVVKGRSGIGPITKFDAGAYRTQIAGEVRDFNPEEFMAKKLVKRLDPFIHYALAATRLAMEDARLSIPPEVAPRAGVITGCGLGGLLTLEETHTTLMEKGPDRVSPFFIPRLIANMAPGQMAIEYGAKGPNLSLQTACAAGTHAVGESFKLIQEDKADIMICGGVESVVTPLALAGFCAMRALSTRNQEPETASRPFDRERDGFVMAEGAGILILESLDRALERGASIYAEVIGYGLSGDAYHMTAPSPDGEGAVLCMRMAIDDAGLKPESVDYINAHGTSTELNDASETKAVKKVFGEHAYKLAISSTKSVTGHLLGAAGGIEAIFTAMTLKEGLIPPTINYRTPDPECDLDYVPNTARQAKVRVALSNSFGFGGTNATLILKRYEE